MEPDFVQVGEMTMVVTGNGYADEPPQDSDPYTFDPDTLKIDMKEQRRELRLRFRSNTQNGDYFMGRVLLSIDSGDVLADTLVALARRYDDLLAGRLDGVASEAWTAAQVGRLGTLPLEALADLFAEQASDFDPMLGRIPAPVNSQVVFDAVTHEHDLRHALGMPGGRDSDAVAVAVGWTLHTGDAALPGLADTLRAAGLDDFTTMRHIVRGLLKQGASVRSFSRSEHAGLRALGVEQSKGDLADAAAVAGHAAGHAAANAAHRKRRPNDDRETDFFRSQHGLI